MHVLLVLCLLTVQTAALEDIPQVKVRPGQDVTLQCQGPRGVNITLLEWIRPELKSEGYVFFYRNRRPYENYHHERFKGRVELTDPSVKHGDVSLILRNVSIRDTGTYKCRIITSNSSSGVRVQSEFKQSINLTVTDSDDDAKEIGEKDGEDKNGRDKERGGKRIPPSVIVIPLAAVGFLVVIAVIAVVIYKKTKKSSKQSGPYQHPPETADVKPVRSVYT
ncbi:uncharacterized protein LOC115776595 isoform X2 [Archocentrus centrarchus]|uniref:uncharacterized protein LOC115776595 isoform X2 n=1 Tax=Archocentrus centrarchus TaxID=63155 RepID=UPI0011E9ED53|nr:uncharacterized protein LOC115776595 isoform X2 [Archocentrus centrarchus]